MSELLPRTASTSDNVGRSQTLAFAFGTARSPTNTSFLNVCGVMNTILMCARFHTSWRSSCLVVPVSSTSADCAALQAQTFAMVQLGQLLRNI